MRLDLASLQITRTATSIPEDAFGSCEPVVGGREGVVSGQWSVNAGEVRCLVSDLPLTTPPCIHWPLTTLSGLRRDIAQGSRDLRSRRTDFQVEEGD